jgi:hypothetical protein
MQTYMPALANGAVAMPSIFGGGQKKGGGYLTLFRGTYTVLVTPFTGDGRHIDEPALRRLVEFQGEKLHPGGLRCRCFDSL